MARESITERNLALESVRVTEAAALAASRLMGRGDEKAADQAAGLASGADRHRSRGAERAGDRRQGGDRGGRAR